MRILLISSSPKKERSQTFFLAKEVVKGFPRSVIVETIHLCDYKVEFCRHCESCHNKITSCPIEDDAGMILEKMLKADGIIFATPNYINQITASMKTLWERASHFIHCRRFLGKYVVGVISSGSGQDNIVSDYIQYYSNICGAMYTGGVFSRTPIKKEKKEESRILGDKMMQDIQEKRVFPEQVKVMEEFKEHFKAIIKMREEEWEEEYQYWLKKGWFS